MGKNTLSSETNIAECRSHLKRPFLSFICAQSISAERKEGREKEPEREKEPDRERDKIAALGRFKCSVYLAKEDTTDKRGNS